MRERVLAKIRAARGWTNGLVAAATPEARARAGRSRSRTMLPGIPGDKITHYRWLTRRKGLVPAEARAAIASMVEAEVRDVRRRMGAAQ